MSYVIPAVDVLGREAVRLLRGNYRSIAVRAGDPFELVRRWAAQAPRLIHVVDLDGAKRGRLDLELVSRAVEAAGVVPIQVGGGVRTLEDARAVIDAGAARVIVGTAVLASRDALAEYVHSLGQKLVVALDVSGDRVAVAGWTRDSGLGLDDAIRDCRAAGVPRVVCTAIDRDGTLSGPNLPLLRRLVASVPAPVVAAGGIRTQADLERLANVGVEAAIVGRALLAGSLPLSTLRGRRPFAQINRKVATR